MRVIRQEDGLAAAVSAAVAALRVPGAVVAVPTETVYGLVCRAADPAAIARIYELKGRESGKPLTLFAVDWQELQEVADLSGLAGRLAAKYTLGAITIVAPGRRGGTVGFRIPDHEFIRTLLRELGEVLASTSANRSGDPEAMTLAEALSRLHGEAALGIDGGALLPGARASTVVDATGKTPKVLRNGPVSLDKNDSGFSLR